MPLILLRAFPPTPDSREESGLSVVQALLIELAQAACLASGRPPEQWRDFWCLFEPITPGYYLEGGVFQGDIHLHTYSPVMTIMAFHTLPHERRPAVMEVLARTVGRHLQVPWENVWIHFQELESGQVFAGGRLLR